MGETFGEFSRDSVVVTGIGTSMTEDLREYLIGKSSIDSPYQVTYDPYPVEYLRQRKTLKFMSKQDRLALESAGNAIENAAIPQEVLRNTTAVFLTVGYIPFELDTAVELCDGSMENGQFSMQKFSTTGIDDINPLLAFACLPNMPAHHVAMNFEIFGQYFITYPDITQFYLALQKAVFRLVNGEIDCALLGGVADQNNFLVMHHYEKVQADAVNLAADCGAFMVLETKSSAQKRKAMIIMELESMEIRWQEKSNSQALSQINNVNMGPAELLLRLVSFMEKESIEYQHNLDNRNVFATSTWKKPL